MLSRARHDRLVADLYASAFGEKAWPDTLGEFAGSFGTGAGVLHLHGGPGEISESQVHGYSEEFARDFYASGAYFRDPRVALITGVKPGTVYFDSMLFDVEEMSRHPAVRETIDALKVAHQLGVSLRIPGISFAGFAVMPTAREGHPSPAAIAAFRRLAPHIEQAATLGRIWEIGAVTQFSLLESLAGRSEGILLLGSSGALVFANDAADAILSADDGLRCAGGRLKAARSSETATLAHLVADAIAVSVGDGDRPGGRMLVSRPSRRRPYALRILPAPALDRFLTRRSIACIVQVQDLSVARVPSKDALCAVFGLTGREADLALGLIRHTALEAAAAEAQMAVNTARNHLKSIFRKTGTAGQAEVIQLLGRLI
jgi:DNA-binding CsgD family transcriptional regulator